MTEDERQRDRRHRVYELVAAHVSAPDSFLGPTAGPAQRELLVAHFVALVDEVERQAAAPPTTVPAAP